MELPAPTTLAIALQVDEVLGDWSPMLEYIRALGFTTRCLKETMYQPQALSSSHFIRCTAGGRGAGRPVSDP